MDRTIKTIVFWIVIVLAGVLLWEVTRSAGSGQQKPAISYSEFLSQVEAGKVATVTISGMEIQGRYRDQGTFSVIAPSSQAAMIEALRQKNVEIWFRDTAQGGWPTWLLNLAPLILLAVLWAFMIRQRSKRPQAPASGTAPTDNSAWQR